MMLFTQEPNESCYVRLPNISGTSVFEEGRDCLEEHGALAAAITRLGHTPQGGEHFLKLLFVVTVT
jgi:hypothetical protein